MTKNNRFSLVAASLMSAALMMASSMGCAVGDIGRFKWPQAEVPDVHPIRRARAEEAVSRFDRERNEAQYQAAEALWRQGDYDLCSEAIEKILLRDPNHRKSLLLSSDVLLESDRPTEAVEVLRRLAALDVNDAEAAYRLGLALEADGNMAEALPYLTMAADRDPRNPHYADACRQAEKHLRGEVESKTNDAVAADAARDAKKTTASKYDAEFATALADWEAGRDAAAVAGVARLLKADPMHIEANILQAEIDLAAKRKSAALERMNRLASRYPANAQVSQAFGLILESAGDAAGAARYFAAARRAAEAGEVVQVSYSEAATAEPVRIAVPTDAASTPLTLQAADRAADRATDAATLLAHGVAALSNRRYDEAQATLRDAVENSNDEGKTALAAAVAALKHEQTELSLELATVGSQRFPQSAGLHRVRGMAAYRLSRYEEAEKSLRQSISLDNTQGLSYFLLGSVRERLGDAEAGKRYFSEAARLDSRYALRK